VSLIVIKCSNAFLQGKQTFIDLSTLDSAMYLAVLFSSKKADTQGPIDPEQKGDEICE
jgi:hypothetical protein